MTSISHFTQPDVASAHFVQFLEHLDKTPAIRAMRLETAQRMGLGAGQKVLDVGCGIGGASFLFADVVGPGGFVGAVDVSTDLVGVASRRAGNRTELEFRVGDALSIPYPDHTFDFAYSERVFLYLPDRLAALREMQRVVRPGGRICLVDVDFDCIALYSASPDVTRKMLSIVAAALPNRNSGRELPFLAKQSGLRDIRIDTWGITTTHEFLLRVASGALSKAVDEGVITRFELDRWLAEQASLDASGDFFQAWLFLSCIGAVG
jgi:ubiquinone/menaquinone biosynthesis C-methylase UbiE